MTDYPTTPKIGELESADKPERRSRAGESLWRRSLRSFLRSRYGMLGLVIVSLLVALALFANFLAPYTPQRLFYGEELVPPSGTHLLGTDIVGRDVFSFVVYGTRAAFMVAFIAVGEAALIGLVIGACAGYFGGRVDNVLMRLTDVILVTPIMFLLIVAVSLFSIRTVAITAVIIGLFIWPYFARIVRSEFLYYRNAMFVDAARTLGANDFRIIVFHILPNALPSLIVTVTTYVAYAILTEAGLSFIGLGDPSAVTWGVMLNVGRDVLRVAPWVVTFPGLMIFITTWAFNLMGDGLRDALDVKTVDL